MSRVDWNKQYQLDWAKLKPPPYLLGATLVLWGILSGHSLLGLSVALMLECHHWVRWRWAFTDQDYIRVWNLCVALFLIVAVFQVVGQELGRWQVTRVFQLWMPILLFPMIWAQQFGRGDAVPLITFSLVARRKRLYDKRAGRELHAPRRANLGYFYFAVLLLSIGAVGRKAPSMGTLLDLSTRSGFGSVSTVYVAVTLLLAWALFALIPRRGWLIACVFLLLASYMGHHVHFGLRMLHGIVEAKTLEWITGRSSADAKRSRTEFGEVGELKLSPKVFWRAKHIEGTRPTLLPEAVYQRYRSRIWMNPRGYARSAPVFRVENQNQWEIANLADVDTTGVMALRGYATGRVQVLPRLDDTALVFDLEAHQLRKNGVGTLTAEPSFSSIKYTVYSGDIIPGQLEAPADTRNDWHIDGLEMPKIREATEALEVPSTASTRGRIQAVERFFADPVNGFRYTKYLSGVGVNDLNSEVSHIGWFLDPKGRAGHCEYYATATVLMLRALRVPTRYVVGYAVQEYDPESEEFVLRGTHRHAWARAWIEEENRWINVDTTPADWLAIEQRPLSPVQRFLDKWDYWMLSWNLWRRDDNKGLLWTLLPLLLAGGLLIVVVLRLFRGLRQSQREISPSGEGGADLDLLGMDSAWFGLEKALADRHWPRPPNQSVAAWCRQLVTVEPAWKPSLPFIVETHYRYRFDPAGVREEELREFESAVATFHEKLAADAAAAKMA